MAARTSVTFGRASDNSVVLRDDLVSRHHARADRHDTGWLLHDLGSSNRTLVNGQPLAEPVLLAEGDRFTIGGTDFRVRGDEFVPEPNSRARLVATDVSYTLPDGRSLLSGVDLDIGPGRLLAIVGPSGAGKSTLLKMLTGALAPDTGAVSYDGLDVHEQRAALATRMGVVPQDDIVHGRLTARQALTYAAALRLPDPVSARRQRVTAILAELDLSAHADTRIDRLSGGQRKRVSVALELLTNPSLLVLDEPTSGLDPALDRQIMLALRAVANSGRTVVVVTHNVINLSCCDTVLVLAPGGVPVFTGPPTELRGRFGTDNWADIFAGVVRTSAHDRPRAATNGDRRPPATTRAAVAATTAPTAGRQFGALVRRHARLILADPGYACFLLLVPFALAALTFAVPGHGGLREITSANPTEAGQILVLLFVGAAFMGGAATAREVIGERLIFLRERATGVRPVVYAAAKAVVFAVVCAVQSAVLAGAVAARKPSPARPLLFGHSVVENGIAVWCTAFAAAMLGLLLSAVVRSVQQVMPILVLTVMAQLVLCGGMIPVTGRPWLAQLSWLAPTRWGYAAGAVTTDLTALEPSVPKDAFWAHSAGWWLLAVGALLVGSAIWWTLLLVRLVRRH